MWASTTPTCPLPNRRPVRVRPSVVRNLTVRSVTGGPSVVPGFVPFEPPHATASKRSTVAHARTDVDLMCAPTRGNVYHVPAITRPATLVDSPALWRKRDA